MNSTKQNLILQNCPYLGLHDDQRTSLAYPSAWNYCYRARPPASVSISHQIAACLCPEYIRLSGLPGSAGRDIARHLARQFHCPSRTPQVCKEKNKAHCMVAVCYYPVDHAGHCRSALLSRLFFFGNGCSPVGLDRPCASGCSSNLHPQCHSSTNPAHCVH